METKLRTLVMNGGGKGLAFYCPGCKLHHHVTIEAGEGYSGPVWRWNGDMDKPTFSPSLGVNMGTEGQCHLFVRDGKIEYLMDSRHEFSGQTIELPSESE